MSERKRTPLLTKAADPPPPAREAVDRRRIPDLRAAGNMATQQALRGRHEMGAGRAVPAAAQLQFATSFGHDLSDVRVHPDAPAVAARGVAAATTGNAIAFAPGAYQPGTAAGRRLIGHELAHVVQQRSSRPATTTAGAEREAEQAGVAAAAGRSATIRHAAADPVQHREYGPLEDTTALGPGDWTYADRLNSSARWHQANLHNLLALRAQEYTQIEQRTAFYRWYYDLIRSMGHEVRWPLAAHAVAHGVHQLANRDPAGLDVMRSNELETLLRRGNQVIFDDVLPKLRDLYLSPTPLTGQAAVDWDSQVLIEEQNLVQPLYEGLSAEALEDMRAGARQAGVLRTIGGAAFGRIEGGPFHAGGAVPPVPEDLDLTRPLDRWRYGMMLGRYFGESPDADTSGIGGTLRWIMARDWAMGLTPPTPSSAYTDGTALARVDAFSKMHAVVARITSAILDVDEIRSEIQALSPAERRVLAGDPAVIAFLRHRHGMDRLAAEMLLTSEDTSDCKLLRLVGPVAAAGDFALDDDVVVMRTGGSWTASGQTRRVSVQAVSEPAIRAFTASGGVPVRWVWDDQLRCYTRPTPPPPPKPVQVTYPVHFDTGNADLENDSNAGTNVATLNRLLDRIATLAGATAVRRMTMRIVGHASPRWRGARTTGQSIAKNVALSRERAANVDAYVRAAYAEFAGPVPILVVGPIVRFGSFLAPDSVDEVSQGGLGPAVGLVLTVDPDNDDATFRRVDVMLQVEFDR